MGAEKSPSVLIWYWHPNGCRSGLELTVLLQLGISKLCLAYNFTEFTWVLFRATAAVLIASTSMERNNFCRIGFFPLLNICLTFSSKNRGRIN